MTIGRILLGLALLSVGGLYLAEQAEVLDAGNAIAKWWPLAIVGLGLLQYATDRRSPLPSALVVAAGLFLLGATTGVFDGDAWRYVWPALLVVAGAWTALGRPLRARSEAETDSVNTLVAFGARQVTSRSRAFRGGSVNVFFGTLDLDLQEAEPAPDARIGATVAFAGLDVTVPEGWQVTTRGIPLFGVWDNTTSRDGIPEDAPTLTINALILFGGLEVRHASRF